MINEVISRVFNIEEIFIEIHLGLIRQPNKYPKTWEGFINGCSHFKVRVVEEKVVGKRFNTICPKGYLIQTLLVKSYHPERWSQPEKVTLRGIKDKVKYLKEETKRRRY